MKMFDFDIKKVLKGRLVVQTKRSVALEIEQLRRQSSGTGGRVADGAVSAAIPARPPLSPGRQTVPVRGVIHSVILFQNRGGSFASDPLFVVLC